MVQVKATLPSAPCQKRVASVLQFAPPLERRDVQRPDGRPAPELAVDAVAQHGVGVEERCNLVGVAGAPGGEQAVDELLHLGVVQCCARSFEGHPDGAHVVEALLVGVG